MMSQPPSPTPRSDVKIDDSVIEQVSSGKILGVVIDSQMNYESSHIDE